MNQRKRNLIVGGVIVAVIALAVGIGWAVQSDRDTTGDDAKAPGEASSSAPQEPSETPSETPTQPPSQTPTEAPPTSAAPSEAPTSSAPALSGPTDADGNVRVALVDKYGMGVGDPEAPVKVEIFVDYQCPHCRDLEEVARQDLLDAATGGSAFVVYRPMAFLNEYSDKAMNAVAVVLDSGNGTAALALHDSLFAKQPSGSVPNDAWFVEQAVAAGADEAKVGDGIRGQEFRQWVVNATDDASQRGVTGTPAVFIDGKAVAGASVEEMAANISAQIF